MGDRFTLEGLNCAYCGEQYPDEVWYAPTCGSIDFVCRSCNKTNYISWVCEPLKIEDIPQDEINWLFEEYADPIITELMRLGKKPQGKSVVCPHSNRAEIETMIENLRIKDSK